MQIPFEMTASPHKPVEWVSEPSRGGTALVLSAGGMYGAYQAGVWSVLSKLMKPDLVIGASIGSLNGWILAGGASPQDLMERWLTLDQASEHRFRVPRRLSQGILDGTLVESWIQKIFAETKPQVPFGVVATAMPSMRPVLFQWPDVTWRHLAASCAVPLFLTQHKIGGVLYADGGLVDPLPLWAGVEMGASRMISVNCLHVRPMAIRIAARAARTIGAYKVRPLGEVPAVVIHPDRPLGDPRDAMYWSRSNAERMIELGRIDARAAEHLVVKCLERA